MLSGVQVLAMPMESQDLPADMVDGSANPTKSYDEKVDIWSIGALTYELLTGVKSEYICF